MGTLGAQGPNPTNVDLPPDARCLEALRKNKLDISLNNLGGQISFLKGTDTLSCSGFTDLALNYGFYISFLK